MLKVVNCLVWINHEDIPEYHFFVSAFICLLVFILMSPVFKYDYQVMCDEIQALTLMQTLIQISSRRGCDSLDSGGNLSGVECFLWNFFLCLFKILAIIVPILFSIFILFR